MSPSLFCQVVAGKKWLLCWRFLRVPYNSRLRSRKSKQPRLVIANTAIGTLTPAAIAVVQFGLSRAVAGTREVEDDEMTQVVVEDGSLEL